MFKPENIILWVFGVLGIVFAVSLFDFAFVNNCGDKETAQRVCDIAQINARAGIPMDDDARESCRCGYGR